VADAGAELEGIPGACLTDQLGQVFQLRRGLEPELLGVAGVKQIGWGKGFQNGLPERWALNKYRCMASNTIKGRRCDAVGSWQKHSRFRLTGEPVGFNCSMTV
jgi:hypothetical protein